MTSDGKSSLCLWQGELKKIMKWKNSFGNKTHQQVSSYHYASGK
jgi:hypothetical protein